jgi:hypothetical protein
MANDPQNPNGTPPPGPAAQGPARTPNDPDVAAFSAALAAFNRSIPAIKEINTQVEGLLEKLKSVDQEQAKVNKHFKQWSNESRQQMTMT